MFDMFDMSDFHDTRTLFAGSMKAVHAPDRQALVSR